ncbi:MAG: PAS domain S-box protein, partial [Dehalococcoidia bacterium]|nr:PAS domain S-box protein [Dehalococcoidia bacterium]
ENAQDAIVIVNPDITIRYESPSMERMTGREAKDRIGKNPFDFCHPDDITKVAEAFIQSLENKIAIVHTELRLQHKNGRWLNFEVIGTNLIDNPSVAGIVLNLREITERKRVEERLQESEERFRALTESTSDWIWEVDLDSVYTYASPKVKDLLGYKPKEILGKTPFDLMPAAEAKRVEEAFRASVESRRPFVELENINMHKDGRLVVLETSGVPIFSDDGRLCGYRGIDRDITERKRVEEALRESEERYRMLVETMNDGMAIQDLDGVMTFVNDKLCQMLGYASDELIGHTAMELIDEVNREKYMEQIRKRRKGVLDPYEIALTRKDGSRLMTRISPQLITDQEGNMVGSFGVATDITDLK